MAPSASAGRTVRLTEDERSTLAELAYLETAIAGELIGWAEGRTDAAEAIEQLRDGISRAEVAATVLTAATAGAVDLGAPGLVRWLDRQEADLRQALDDDRAMLAGAAASDRPSALRFVDEDLDGLLLVQRLLAEAGR